MCPQTERTLTLMFFAKTYIYTIFKRVEFSKKFPISVKGANALEQEQDILMTTGHDCHGIWHIYICGPPDDDPI